MHLIKNLKISFAALVLFVFVGTNVNSAEECFEGTSRAIFKFNMVLDDIVLTLSKRLQ